MDEALLHSRKFNGIAVVLFAFLRAVNAHDQHNRVSLLSQPDGLAEQTLANGVAGRSVGGGLSPGELEERNGGISAASNRDAWGFGSGTKDLSAATTTASKAAAATPTTSAWPATEAAATPATLDALSGGGWRVRKLDGDIVSRILLQMDRIARSAQGATLHFVHDRFAINRYAESIATLCAELIFAGGRWHEDAGHLDSERRLEGDAAGCVGHFQSARFRHFGANRMSQAGDVGCVGDRETVFALRGISEQVVGFHKFRQRDRASERDVCGAGENMVGADGLPDAVQNADLMLRRWMAVVIAQLHVKSVRIGAEHGDGANAGLEREGVIGVFEEHHCFVSGLESEGVVLLGVIHVRGDLVVGIAGVSGWIEFAQSNAGFHDASNGHVNFLLGNQLLKNRLDQVGRREIASAATASSVGRATVEVVAGLYRQGRGLRPHFERSGGY